MTNSTNRTKFSGHLESIRRSTTLIHTFHLTCFQFHIQYKQRCTRFLIQKENKNTNKTILHFDSFAKKNIAPKMYRIIKLKLFKTKAESNRFQHQRMMEQKTTDEKIETVLLWLLYALIILFIICQNSWLVYTIEHYLYECIPVIVKHSMYFIYGSIDWIAPLFIVVWYFRQAGDVKMNLSNTKQIICSTHEYPQTIGVPIRPEVSTHRYAEYERYKRLF